MTATKQTRPRTFVTALAAWPQCLAAVAADPCDATLQALCTLLDVMDGEMCRHWNNPGHEDRRAAFEECRREAGDANAHVASAGLAAARRRAAAANAAKAEKAEKAEVAR